MTRERRYHVIAVSLMVAGVVAGGVCWALQGTAVWVLCGIALALIVAGIYFAGRASAEDQRRKKQEELD
jgi:hypothetical protein